MKGFLKISLLLFILSLLNNVSYAQLNVALLHQLVANSKNEHEKQVEARDKQRNNFITEGVNTDRLKTVKEKYRTLQDRFAKLSILFDAVGVATSANPLVNSIVDNQQQIVYYCQQDPILIPFALETNKIFVSRSYSLLNYLIGLSVSIGDLNQMKVSERRLLFRHILNELEQINGLSYSTSQALKAHIQRTQGGNPYQDYLNTEQQLVDEIMLNAKILLK